MAELAENRKYKIYSILSYNDGTKKFIKEQGEEYDNVKDIEKKIKEDNYYNFRIMKGRKYVFFGDIDKLKMKIDELIKIIQKFMLEKYGLKFTKSEFKYTKNDGKEGSYHYSIPKWNCSCEKLKEIHNNIKKEHINLKEVIDTKVYSNHWYRCPNQSKGDEEEHNCHRIVNGKLKDFIVEYIPKNSENIENIKYINGTALNEENPKKSKKNTKDEGKKKVENKELLKDDNDENIMEYESDNSIKEINPNKSIIKYEIVKSKNVLLKNENTNNKLINIESKIINYDKELLLSRMLSNSNMYKKMFDECYKQDRFEDYDDWLSVGMAIRNIFTDTEEAFELFNYYSSKGSKYEGEEKTKYKFLSLKRDANGFTVATIYYFAKEDNKPKFIEIMNKNTLELSQTDICEYIKILVGYKFIYKVEGTNYKLYCYNGKYWQNDDVLLKSCISKELFKFLKMILTEVYWNTIEFNKLKKKLDKLTDLTYKEQIVKTYKEYGVNNEVKFDEKWWLFGFTDCVYDMNEKKIREYKYDDYVSITCGYKWREPTKEEIKTIQNLLMLIMPMKEERYLLLRLMCTGLEGRCLERFIILNGSGGNGKGLINDLMLAAMGNYGLIGNNGILFENSKTGSNPEKSNLHKKRWVVFREPSERNKFENSVIKELTGGGKFSARTHNEKETEKELNLTMVIECNKKPLFTEEPKESEVRRIVDIPFRSTFTTNKEDLDESKYIYMANPTYKTEEFKQKHKYALLKILMDEHKEYINNESIIELPKSIIDRTNKYLELSCNILQWFKDNYEEIKTEDVVLLKISDVYTIFENSKYRSNLSKKDQNTYNGKYFIDYFKDNIFLRKYYKKRHGNIRNVMINWKLRVDVEEE